MKQGFSFGDPATRLEVLLAFVDYWLGPQVEPHTPVLDLDGLHLPDPYKRFLEHTYDHRKEDGSWFWQDTVPQLHLPPAIRAVDGDLVIASYLGECEARVQQGSADTGVVEHDTEEAVYHSSLTDFLVRIVLRHLASTRPRPVAIAGYSDIARQQIAIQAPLYDVTWRLPDPRNPSIEHSPPFNPTQQTPVERVWLIEDGDMLVYTHEGTNEIVFTARNHETVERLIQRHGTAQPSLLDIQLGQLPELTSRQQWRLRVRADGSAQMSLPVTGIPTAIVATGSLDLADLTSALIGAATDDGESAIGSTRVTVVRGPSDSGTRYFHTRAQLVDIVQTFLDAVEEPTAEFSAAWQRYQPSFMHK